ncbi:MAG: ribonuclease P protein component 1 [Candidatus Aenigmarchaeota archaeon]|nr:ribonuclease P protein component 1 [Candidatus Aenigmarchaeota archaeon]
MITKKNLPRHEFIGLKVKVIESKNKSQVGLKGKIIDETQKTLKIETRDGEKVIQKSGCIFKFMLPRGKSMMLSGDAIVARPEDRIRKKFKEWDIV